MEDGKKLMELFEKKNIIFKLVDEIHLPVLLEYFDFESDEHLDKKIKALKQVKAGKDIFEIDGFRDVIEKYPEEGVRI